MALFKVCFCLTTIAPDAEFNEKLQQYETKLIEKFEKIRSTLYEKILENGIKMDVDEDLMQFATFTPLAPEDPEADHFSTLVELSRSKTKYTSIRNYICHGSALILMDKIYPEGLVLF